jgi:hypothetical protein
MKLRNTAIWLVLFAALGLFAWSLRDSEPRQVGPNAPTPTPNPVFEFDASAVTAVRVEGGGESYELTRDDADDWLVDGQAGSDSINSTVEGAANPSVLRVLPEDRDPEDYGFASPWLTVTFTVSDTQRQLFVGDEVPTSAGDRYVREGTDGAMRTVSAFDLQRLHEWLTDPPLAPTPTPVATETPEGGDEADSETEDAAEEEDAAEGSTDEGEAEEGDGLEGDTADGDETSGDEEGEDPEASEDAGESGAAAEDAGGESGEVTLTGTPAASATPEATGTPASDAGDDG